MIGRMGGAWYGDGGGGPRLPTGGRRADHAAARTAAGPAGRMPGGPMAGQDAGRPTRRAAGRAVGAGAAASERREGHGAGLGHLHFRRARCPTGLWGGPAWMAGRGGAAPFSSPLTPTQHETRRTRRLPLCRRSPHPPRYCLGGAGEHRRLSRRNPGTMPGPGDSGFSMGHAAGWAGSAVPGRRQRPAQAGGMPHAGAGVGGWTRRWAPRKPMRYQPAKSARVSVPLPTAGPPQCIGNDDAVG